MGQSNIKSHKTDSALQDSTVSSIIKAAYGDQPLFVDLTWEAHIHGHKLSPTNDANSPLSSVPIKWITSGNPEKRFLAMADSRKGKFKAGNCSS